VNRIAKNVVLFLLAGATAVFVLVFATLAARYAGAVREEGLAVAALRNRLALVLALSHALRLFPATLLFVYTACFSVCFTLFPFQTQTFSFSRVAVPSFVLLMIFLAFTALSGFIFVPGLNKSTQRMRHRAQVAQAALDHAVLLKNAGRPERALEVLAVYLREDPSGNKALELREELMSTAPSSGGGEPAPRGQAGEAVERPATSLERGKAAYWREEYHEALYYFERALELHPNNRELRELHRRAREMADRELGRLTGGEREQALLIRHKEQALAHLERGEHYQAYEILQELHRSFPGLRDLELYLEQVESELRRVDFTAEELQRHAWLPGYPDVLFLDRAGALNTVGKMVSWRGEYYFYQVSRYREGRAAETWKYGKWLDGRIRLKNADGYRKVPPEQEDRFFIEPFAGPGYLVLAARSGSDDQLNLFERFAHTEALVKSGMRLPGLEEYLAGQVGVLFSLYVLAVALGGIAWSKRSIYEFPPLWKLAVFLVTVPFLCFFLQRFYTGANQMLVHLHRYVVRLLPGVGLLLLVTVVNAAAALAATLFFLSRDSGME
jgi:tetratricopeptide (TPR) repeat protein